MSPTLSHIDHFVLTVRNIPATVAFYEKLGMQTETFQPADGTTRTALKFGNQKINLHEAGYEFEPKAETPTAGSADFCLITKTPLSGWITHLATNSITIEKGPVSRTGAMGPIQSLYIRDPDRNLVEISHYI